MKRKWQPNDLIFLYLMVFTTLAMGGLVIAKILGA